MTILLDHSTIEISKRLRGEDSSLIHKSEGPGPLVSVIVLNHNGRQFLEACLSTVLESVYPNFEVEFVDNGSTDGSVEFVTARYRTDPRVRIVVSHRNLGFGGGNNVGATYARGSFLVFLNNDTQTVRDWLSELVKVALSDNRVGIAFCRILSKFDPEGSYIGNVDRFGGGVLMKVGEHVQSPETIASGPAFLITREAWDSLGGFDSKYFAYEEDIDLAWRAKLLGYRVVPALNSKVYHAVGGTTGRTGLDRRRYLTYRNTLRTLVKNYSRASYLKTLPVFALSSFLQSVALACAERDARIALSPVKALLWNLTNLKDTWRLHQRVQESRVVTDREIERVMAASNPITTLIHARPPIMYERTS